MHVFFLRVSVLSLLSLTKFIPCIEIDKLTLCTCTSPALQLLKRGFFPCAPVSPSVAVDLNMLEFVNELFVNAAPNTTAWCETLESFLGNRKYKLTTRVSSKIVLTDFFDFFFRIVCGAALEMLCSGMLH